MKFLIDMNLSPRWAETLRAAGFDAIHWSLVGAASASDPIILGYAKAQRLILITSDLDFSAILAATAGDAPSVVQIRGEDLTPEALGAVVIEAIQRGAAELDDGAIMSVDAQRARLRKLPLSRPQG